MRTRTHPTPRQWFVLGIVAGCVLFVCGAVLALVGHWSEPERAQLKLVTGRVVVLSHRRTPQGYEFLDIDLTTDDGAVHLSQDDLSDCYPALLGLKPGDTIEALYKPDEMGRAIDWYWEIRKANQIVLAYDQTLAAQQRLDRLGSEAGRGAMWMGAVLAALAIAGRQWARKREAPSAIASREAVAPSTLAKVAAGVVAVPPPPRRVRRRRGTDKSYLLFMLLGLPTLAVACGLTWMAIVPILGRHVTAEVVGVEMRPLRDGTPGFRARLASGGADSRHFFTVATDEAIYARFAPPPIGAGEHGRVTAREMTLGPLHRVIIEGHPPASQSLLFRSGLVTVGCFLMLWGMLLFAGWRVRRFCELAIAAEGTVTNLTRSRRGAGDDISYEYVDTNGVRYRGVATAPRRSLSEAMLPGTTVTVLYDPRKPAASIVYELSSFEVSSER